MGYVIKKGTGGGGGDATAANQVTQINVANTTNTLFDTSSTPSVFKEPTTGNSVFLNEAGTQSLFYKSLENTDALSNPNAIRCISFTNVTAAGVTADLNTFLIANNCFICGLTATQSIGSHDLYLLYST
jgi:hypothetical protein